MHEWMINRSATLYVKYNLNLKNTNCYEDIIVIIPVIWLESVQVFNDKYKYETLYLALEFEFK